MGPDLAPTWRCLHRTPASWARGPDLLPRPPVLAAAAAGAPLWTPSTSVTPPPPHPRLDAKTELQLAVDYSLVVVEDVIEGEDEDEARVEDVAPSEAARPPSLSPTW